MGEPAHCRVGRVRMKAGGADVKVIGSPSHDERSVRLMRYAREQAVESAPLAGFVMVTWDYAGCYQLSADANGRDNPVPLSLLPSWVEEIIRRELVTSQQVRQVILQEYDVTPPRRPPA